MFTVRDGPTGRLLSCAACSWALVCAAEGILPSGMPTSAEAAVSVARASEDGEGLPEGLGVVVTSPLAVPICRARLLGGRQDGAWAVVGVQSPGPRMSWRFL